MSASLVGSEMCIRDRFRRLSTRILSARGSRVSIRAPAPFGKGRSEAKRLCLLYTSDAADDM
eukprot:3196256-Alexandrium_andersonii.AAC.1